MKNGQLLNHILRFGIKSIQDNQSEKSTTFFPKKIITTLKRECSQKTRFTYRSLPTVILPIIWQH